MPVLKALRCAADECGKKKADGAELCAEHLHAAAPASGHAALLESAPSPIVAPESTVVETTVDSPVAMRSATPSDAKEPDQPNRRRVDVLDAISQQLGAKFWRTNAQFEWCRMPNTYKHTFTRFYFEQNVLLDIFAGKGASIEKEIAQKSAAIAAENVRREAEGKAPLGYITTVRGATIPFEYFQRAKDGETLPLCVRVDLVAVPA